ncbi:hypothetical protein V6Z11_D07G152400 [Gossypium hirsutum]
MLVFIVANKRGRISGCTIGHRQLTRRLLSDVKVPQMDRLLNCTLKRGRPRK